MLFSFVDSFPFAAKGKKKKYHYETNNSSYWYGLFSMFSQYREEVEYT